MPGGKILKILEKKAKIAKNYVTFVSSDKLFKDDVASVTSMQFLYTSRIIKSEENSNKAIGNCELLCHSHLCTEQLIYISALSYLRKSPEISAVW